MSRASTAPIRGYIGQFAVVMLGVLAALVLDRWVQSLDLRSTELAYLQALRDDFTENRDIAIEFRRAHGEIHDRAAAVLRATSSAEVVPEDFTALAAAVEFASWSHGLRFVSDTWDDLIGTGNSAVLRDKELRVALRRFYNRRNRLESFESEWQAFRMAYRDAAIEILAPEVRVALVPIFFGETAVVVPGDVHALHRALRSSPRIRERVTDVLLAAQGGQMLYGDIVADIDAVLTRIDHNLKRGAEP